MDGRRTNGTEARTGGGVRTPRRRILSEWAVLLGTVAAAYALAGIAVLALW